MERLLGTIVFLEISAISYPIIYRLKMVQW